MKKNMLSAVLAALTAFSMTATSFATIISPTVGTVMDVPDDAWYEPAVKYAVENELLDPYFIMTRVLFEPDSLMSRSAVADAVYRDAKQTDETLVSEAAGMGVEEMQDFRADRLDAPALRFCFEAGVMTGDSEKRLHPEDPITREEFAAVLTRYDQLLRIREAERKTGVPISAVGFANWYEAEAAVKAFSDYDTISE